MSHRLPEISDEIFRIDDAARGFGWELGAFKAGMPWPRGLKACADRGWTWPWVHELVLQAPHRSTARPTESELAGMWPPKHTVIPGKRGASPLPYWTRTRRLVQ